MPILKDINNNKNKMWPSFLVIYGWFAVFPFLIFLTYKYLKQKKKNWKIQIWYFLYFMLSMLFIYARFIEPQMIIVKHKEIQTGFQGRFVLIADLHLWIFKNERFLKKIIKKIQNLENIDGVLIPWDFTLVLDQNTDLEKLFSPFSKLDIPIYATLWNHDTMKPWPNISANLRNVLEKNKIIVLNNEKSQLISKNIQILWLWDNWSNDDKTEMIREYSAEDNLIVLAHNPDTTLKYTNNIADLTVSGHTHWGQIRIPFIWKKVLPVKGNFIDGYYENNGIKLYITSWAWEVWLPLRFRIPPEIVILDLIK